MPTTYTHYRYGSDVLATLPKPLKESIQKHREIFDLGCHGPDLLFYNMSPKNAFLNQLGSELHKVPSTIFFEHALKVLETSEDKVAARAYIYGFLCHFALDSQLHGYVEKMIYESGVPHNEVEMEFDRFLLVEDKIEPVSYKRSKLVIAKPHYARVIAPFFEGLKFKNEDQVEIHIDTVEAKQIYASIQGMQRILNLLTAPSWIKRNILKVLMKASKQYDDKYGLILSAKPNPACDTFNRLLRKEYAGAIPIGVSLILYFQKVLLDQGELHERFQLTFGPGSDWMKLMLS